MGVTGDQLRVELEKVELPPDLTIGELTASDDGSPLVSR